VGWEEGMTGRPERREREREREHMRPLGGPELTQKERESGWRVGPTQFFSNSNNFSPASTTCKMAKLSFPNYKNYQNVWGGRINQKEQLSYWEKIQNQKEFWIKNSGSTQYFKLVWIFKSTKPFGKKSQ
jgi:hypothetical protein